MSLAILAAMPEEIAPLCRALSLRPDPTAPSPALRVGQYRKAKVVVAWSGVGYAAAARTAQSVLEWAQPDAVWSVGLCGALRSDLAVGDVVRGKLVIDRANGEQFVAETDDNRKGSTIVSQDRIAVTSKEKHALSAWGDVVEMEAAMVARRSHSLSVSFSCAKVVSDAAEEDFAIDLNLARTATGFSTGKILLQAARSPWRALPGLARLMARQRDCSRLLCEYLLAYAF